MNPAQTDNSQAEYTHLGAYFRDLREHYELSIEQVSSRLHIQPKYLQALEEGNMSALPGRVYTQGYIQSYAEFLGLDAASVLQQYEGLGAIEKKQEFRIAPPTQQAGTPAWRWIVMGALALAMAYGAIKWASSASKTQAPLPPSTVTPVPERLLKKAAAPLILTDTNKRCLQMAAAQEALPCYYLANPSAGTPIRSIMELRR